jgi:predicted transcriptional regulator
MKSHGRPEAADRKIPGSGMRRVAEAEPNMSKTLPVSVRLSPELNQQVADIARALDRPMSWVIERAIKDFVAVQGWHLAAIDEGIQDADAGRVVSHDEVAAWVRSWDEPDELPMPTWR